ncbi:MAG: hypothetical protein ACREP9_07835 [Candidatus Dormibacteraceae bacterium]
MFLEEPLDDARCGRFTLTGDAEYVPYDQGGVMPEETTTNHKEELPAVSIDSAEEWRLFAKIAPPLVKALSTESEAKITPFADAADSLLWQSLALVKYLEEDARIDRGDPELRQETAAVVGAAKDLYDEMTKVGYRR